MLPATLWDRLYSTQSIPGGRTRIRYGFRLGFLLTALTTVSWGQCFNPATNFAVGSTPYSVVKGDFNTDGKPDLVTVNTDANTISLLLNNGSGGFGAAITFSVGNSPRSAAVGDFNGDSKLDLATANASNTVSVLLGDGNGGFTTSSISVPGIPLSVAAGDVNGDGKLDLVTGTYSYGTVTVMPGNGSGGFGNQTSFSVGHQPTSITMGDFNGDGKPDLTTSNQNTDKLSILLNNGSGGFGPASDVSTGGVTYSVALGDFNGDGKSDLATANSNIKTVSVLLGTGTGSFGSATNFGLVGYPNSPVVGDFDTDGKLDLAVVYAGGQVSVLSGIGNGSLGPETFFTVDTGGLSMVAGDFNGDGRPDLTTANYNAKTVSILLNCPSQQPNTPPTVANVIPAQVGTVNQNFSYDIPMNTFTDAETPNNLTYSVNGLPVGLAFTGPINISGIPTTALGSPFTVTVTATDPGNLSVNTTFLLTINTAVVNPPPPPTAGFAITNVTTVNCTTVTAGQRTLTFTPIYAGTTGQPISFSVVNEMVSTTNPGPYTLSMYIDNPVITLKATQTGTAGEASFVYNWLAVCGAGSPPPPPPPSGNFAITGISTVSCQMISATQRSLSFTPTYNGQNGQPISFSVVNEMSPTTNPGPYTLSMYIDNPVITLKATQSGTPGEVSFVYDWLAACTGNARLGAEPGVDAWTLRSLGNPVTSEIVVELADATGQPVLLSLISPTGWVVERRMVTPATLAHREVFDVTDQGAGMLLLRAESASRNQTLKLLKQ